jgi:hypothetical protein
MRPAMPWYSSSSTMPSIPALLRSAAIATAVARHAQSMPNVVCTDSSGKILNVGVFLMDFLFLSLSSFRNGFPRRSVCQDVEEVS